jgi:hypothetical protein
MEPVVRVASHLRQKEWATAETYGFFRIESLHFVSIMLQNSIFHERTSLAICGIGDTLCHAKLEYVGSGLKRLLGQRTIVGILLSIVSDQKICEGVSNAQMDPLSTA